MGRIYINVFVSGISITRIEDIENGVQFIL